MKDQKKKMGMLLIKMKERQTKMKKRKLKMISRNGNKGSNRENKMKVIK